MYILSVPIALILAIPLSLYSCISVIYPTNGRLPSTMVVSTKTPTTIDQCARWCIYLTACRSMGHHTISKTCALHAVENVTVSSQYIQDMGWMHMMKEQWPQAVAGPCQNHTCSITEMCVPIGMTNTTCIIFKGTLSCSSSPCHNGTCYETIDSFVCHCDLGYTGTLCSEGILECLSNPCYNTGTCNELVNGYTCTCPYDHTGVHCETYRCFNRNNYRLCDGGGQGIPSSSRGRLEYYYNDTWGIFCDDFWPDQTNGPISDQNPVVACKVFGYSGGRARARSYYGIADGLFHPGLVQCEGSELYLHDCPLVTSFGCNPDEQVGIECY